jgi:hypothetical protein
MAVRPTLAKTAQTQPYDRSTASAGQIPKKLSRTI